jgi:hypothetical protein
MSEVDDEEDIHTLRLTMRRISCSSQGGRP